VLSYYYSVYVLLSAFTLEICDGVDDERDLKCNSVDIHPFILCHHHFIVKNGDNILYSSSVHFIHRWNQVYTPLEFIRH